jgi:hypothetical protein
LKLCIVFACRAEPSLTEWTSAVKALGLHPTLKKEIFSTARCLETAVYILTLYVLMLYM